MVDLLRQSGMITGCSGNGPGGPEGALPLVAPMCQEEGQQQPNILILPGKWAEFIVVGGMSQLLLCVQQNMVHL